MDRMAAEISIGGPICAQWVPGLLQSLRDEGIRMTGGFAEFDPVRVCDLLEAAKANDQPAPLRLRDDEVAGGTFDLLERFLVEHGIAFDRSSEADWGYNAVLVQFRPGMTEPLWHIATQEGEAVVERNRVVQALDALRVGQTDRAVQMLEAVVGPEIEPLQPLEIVTRRRGCRCVHVDAADGRNPRGCYQSTVSRRCVVEVLSLWMGKKWMQEFGAEAKRIGVTHRQLLLKMFELWCVAGSPPGPAPKKKSYKGTATKGS